MCHEQLKAELLEARKEIERLKQWESMSTTPIVHKDLSLISVIDKWSGSDDTVTMEEFLILRKDRAMDRKWPMEGRSFKAYRLCKIILSVLWWTARTGSNLAII